MNRRVRGTVTQTGPKSELVFHGVDCLATYWLNGKMIGESDNMFIEHRFDVTDDLKTDSANVITVRLRSPVLEAMNKSYHPYMSSLPTNFEQLWIRKAPHSYGWDIMPRAVSAGLWRSVEIVVLDVCEIDDIYFATVSAGPNHARVRAHYQVSVDPAMLDDLSLRLSGTCGDSSFESTTRLLFVAGSTEFTVDKPKLWWPRGYGEANLYEVKAELLHGGEVVATRCFTIGIRTFELLRSELAGPENDGKFLLKVNGSPIMCKGSNWVPADTCFTAETRAVTRRCWTCTRTSTATYCAVGAEMFTRTTVLRPL